MESVGRELLRPRLEVEPEMPRARMCAEHRGEFARHERRREQIVQLEAQARDPLARLVELLRLPCARANSQKSEKSENL